MEFSNKAKELLRKMGWTPGRRISLGELKLPYNDYPPAVIAFLQEYGNLEGECEKQDYTEVVNKIYLYPETEKLFLEGDNNFPFYQSILRKKLYPIGAYDGGSGYDVCCDADGRVYKIGEYCFYVGKNLYEGIENILLMNTLKSLQLDEDTGQWWGRNGQHEELPLLS